MPDRFFARSALEIILYIDIVLTSINATNGGPASNLHYGKSTGSTSPK